MSTKKIYSSITEIIGNTPIVRLKKIEERYNVKTQLYAKLEYLNPFGSVKDRITFTLIQNAWKKNNYNRNTIIVGINFGDISISIASIAASKGLKCVIVVYGDVSNKVLTMLELLNAFIVFTSDIEEAIEQATTLVKDFKLAVMINPFDDEDCVKVHETTTAKEILESINDVDYFVSGVDTGATITGVGKVLKKMNPKTVVVAVEPWEASMLSGKKVRSCEVKGMGVGLLPRILNINIIDYVFRVKIQEMIEYVRSLLSSEGIATGLTSGAAICAAVNLGIDVNDSSKKILTILPSSIDNDIPIIPFDNGCQLVATQNPSVSYKLIAYYVLFLLVPSEMKKPKQTIKVTRYSCKVIPAVIQLLTLK
ncbi:pyridoxal-phosphate dependent enzyme [Candidatus Hodgkinia cicadicola]|uniref:PLP-dependent cysteine synthase family protein n=1 Tax=Candidatus Hodgkinia cicadicola TaxID=573658 RepID=UPI0011BA6ADC